jgi:hypothetical protein
MESSQPVTMHAPAKYRFLGKLGEGGMAEVFVGVMGQPPGFRKLLVLKLLRTSLAEEIDGLAMFLDEARLAARLNHRNVVQTYEVGRVGERHAIVMEFLEGASVSKLARAALPRGGLPIAECVYILCEALCGLHYAHELKDFDGSPLSFVHRDFTPANLMVTLDGQVKVLDFGVAKTRANLAHTQTGTLKGTARFMARESVLGMKVDRRTDVYMAGAVLFQLLTRTRPWDDKEEIAVLAAILEQRLPPVRRLDPALPPDLEAIIYRATDPDPEARYGSAHELREALLAFLREHGLASNADRLALLVQELSGAECEALRRRIDQQLSEVGPQPDVMLAATVAAPSIPGVDPSASRVRVTGGYESTLARLRRHPMRVAGVLLCAGAVGLAAALALYEPRTTETGIHVTLKLPSYALPGAAQPPQAALHTSELTAPLVHELPVAPEPIHVRAALRISARPNQAQLFLDGAHLSGNPALLNVDRDEALHELRAEAAGFLPKILLIRFNEDAEVALELSAEQAPPPAKHHHRATLRAMHGKPSPAKQPDVSRVSQPREGTPTRAIDTESPWQL